MKKSWKPRLHELDYESKMRLLKTQAHASILQGYEAGKVRQRRARTEDLALRDWNKSSTKAIANALRNEGRARKGRRKSEK